MALKSLEGSRSLGPSRVLEVRFLAAFRVGVVLFLREFEPSPASVALNLAVPCCTCQDVLNFFAKCSDPGSAHCARPFAQ